MQQQSNDRISDLPEPLVQHILSSLPTKLAVSTTVLSKRWRSVSDTSPNLKFETYKTTPEFSEYVCMSLLKTPVLKSLHLKMGSDCDDVYIGVWLGIAFTRHVREFVLDYGKRIRFPTSLLCFDKLETLKLKNYVFMDFPTLVALNSLKTLHIESVVFKDESSVRNLFSSCPYLEHLVVHRGSRNIAVVKFVIVALFLKTLSFHESDYGGKGSYVINAPSLEYLNIGELNGYELFLSENAFERLVEASIRNVTCNGNEMVIRSLKSAKRLSFDLTSLQIAFPIGLFFGRLVHLEMYTHKTEWWNLLTLMLDSSPKLQVLKLIGDYSSKSQHNREYEKESKDQGKWNEPEHVPECLLFCLERVVWIRHDWVREEEKEVALYILRNARQLKKATFTAYPIESKRHFMLARRREMLSELDGVVKASSSCELVFPVE